MEFSVLIIQMTELMSHYEADRIKIFVLQIQQFDYFCVQMHIVLAWNPGCICIDSAVHLFNINFRFLLEAEKL